MSEELQDTASAAPEPIEQTPDTDQADKAQVTDEGQDEAPKPKRSKSAREALEKAFAGGSETKPTDEEVEAAEAKAAEKKQPKDEAKKAEKGPQRGADGKFAAKDAEKPQDGQEAKEAPKSKADHNAPPQRFSADAKAEWEKAPESVRAETYRMQRELEKGLREKDETLKPLEPFVKMAKEHGTTVHDALGNYVRMEQMLRSNPRQGLIALAQNMGMSPQQMGQMLLGQQPGQPDPRDQQIMALQQRLQQFEQQFGQVTQTVQQQQQQAVMSQIEQFAADKPRFDELADEIVRLIETGYASDLEDAYTKAERLNPAPQPAPQPEPTPAPPAQTRPARSLTGAPSPGSNPTTKRTPAKNAREALKRHLLG